MEEMNQDIRMNLLIHLIDYLNKHQTDNRSGETHIQKLFYFLIRSKLVPLCDNYVIYNYGPFSFELKNDIHQLEESKQIIREPSEDGFGFKLLPNLTNEKVSSLITQKNDTYNEIDRLLEKFNSYSAKDLGLLATFIYLRDEIKIKNEGLLIETVARLKPMFTKKDLLTFYHKNKDKMNIEDLLSI